jgi:hypothetical protein
MFLNFSPSCINPHFARLMTAPDMPRTTVRALCKDFGVPRTTWPKLATAFKLLGVLGPAGAEPRKSPQPQIARYHAAALTYFLTHTQGEERVRSAVVRFQIKANGSVWAKVRDMLVNGGWLAIDGSGCYMPDSARQQIAALQP